MVYSIITSIYAFFSFANALWFIITTIGLYFLLKVILFFLLWFKHDRPIKSIHNELLDIPSKINESNRGRGVVTSSQEMQIKAAQGPLEIELKKRQLNRQLFLDRIHLISFLKRN